MSACHRTIRAKPIVVVGCFGFWLAMAVHAFLQPTQHPSRRSRFVKSRAEWSTIWATASTSNEKGASPEPNSPRKVAIVGGGPSGLLLSHLLMKQNNCSVTLLDGRSDPRDFHALEGRAYALGIGIRGREAIRSVDESLWKAVKDRGYESERFNLHIGLPFEREWIFPLRSDSKPLNGESVVEPSLLIYQSELCAALLGELEERYRESLHSDNLFVRYGTKVTGCNFDDMTIEAKRFNETTMDTLGPFDLIVGADGVNSCVRSSMEKDFQSFAFTKERLPGLFKVVRLNQTVGESLPDGKEPYDPKAVSLLIPSGAFIEPTGNDGSCCILFSGRETSDSTQNNLPVYLKEAENITAVVEGLESRFPLWKKDCFESIAKQLVAQNLTANSAYSVTCNTYHYEDKAVLIGDAAHATGGVSGQGVNSALVDAKVLADCLHEKEETSLRDILMEYTSLQLPEGKALYDLSFGPNPQGTKKKVLWALWNARDALFAGRFGIGNLPLQTRLSSELTSFTAIRRERDYFYRDDNEEDVSQSFPSNEDFGEQLRILHS